MRVLAIDVGRRRIGLAISDPTGTLARPLGTMSVGPQDAVEKVATEIARLEAEEDGLSTIVIGLPVALAGTPTDATAHVEKFIAQLRRRTTLPLVLADERLTSREAESLLAIQEKDWRKRKQKLDAAAAAIILQEYLDR